MSYRTSEDFATETSARLRRLDGMIRRLEFLIVDGSRWQVRGQRATAQTQGGDEVFYSTPFAGFGFYATPPASGSPEVVVASVGGPKTTVVIAARDEATRLLVAGAIADQGSTCVYNDKAMILINPDGAVEIRLINGVAIPLATKADIDALASWSKAHVHLAPGGLTPAITTGPVIAPTGAVPDVPPAAAGTSVLKAQ